MKQGGKQSGGSLRLSPSTAEQAGTHQSDRPAGFPGTLPLWGAETMTPPVSDPFAPGAFVRGEPATFSGTDGCDEQPNRGEAYERGWRPMARIARIAAALSALATIFLVAGAGNKY